MTETTSQDPDTTDPTTPTSEQDLSGAELLDEIHAFVTRFLVLPSPAAEDAFTLWAMHTHARDDADRRLIFEVTPRLAILSDQPGSAKTLAMTLLELLCPRAAVISQPTAPALVTLIRDEAATVLLDEIDMLFGPGNGQKDTRALLNSGYKRSGKTARANGLIYTFAPFALAGLASNFLSNDKLKPTRERSIILRMRKRDEQPIDKFRERLHKPQAHRLAESMWSWSQANLGELATAWPDLPDGLDDRTEEIWEPLFAVAEVAGGRWPERATAACKGLALGEGELEPTQSPRQLLMADLSRVFFGADRLGSQTIVDRLYELGGRWQRLWPSKTAALRELAAMVGSYGVEVRKIRIDGQPPVQGYYWADLEPFVPERVPEENDT